MKFSQAWLDEYVDIAAAGGADAIRRLLEQAGFPVEGMEAADADTVFEIEITPNRPDAMNHRGLAREIGAMAALPGRDVTAFRGEPPSSGPPASDLTSVTIEVPRLCRRFGARVLRGISHASAAKRVRERLEAIGAKPISAAVDATNYVLWDLGQPLHAFDLDRLAGGRVVVRRARKGEKLVTLDGIERSLEPSDIVVADAERAVSLAGIMGGLKTSVTAETRNVLLEAAWWDPVAIRRTSRRLGMHTDASHRFERGADPEAIPAGLSQAAGIILESAGGTLAPGILDARGQGEAPRRATLRLSRLRLVAGDDRLDLDFAEQALARLGFSPVRRGKRVAVSVPSFRRDVSIEEDLIEDVLRVYGYEKIPARLPPASGGGGYLEPLAVVERVLSDRAVAAGLFETVNYPFVNRVEEERPFQPWLAETGTAPEPLSIANPLDENRRDLRATLLPGLLDALARNVHHGRRDAALFETGRVFGKPGEPDRPESFEGRRFAFAFSGDSRPDWSLPGPSRRADFFDAKGLVEALLLPWRGPESLSWRLFAAEGFTPGAAAIVRSEGDLLAVAGLVAEKEREKRKLPEAVFAGELVLEAISVPEEPTRFRAFSPYPSVEADISFTHSLRKHWGEIESFIGGAKLADLESYRLQDRYQGAGVLEGDVKTTIHLVFRSPARTLAQEAVNREVERLLRELESRFGA